MKVPLVGVRAALLLACTGLQCTDGLALVGGASSVSSPSPLDGVGGSLMVGCFDLVFWVETRVAEGPDECGFREIGLHFFVGTSLSFDYSYCIPLLAFLGILLEQIFGFCECDRV